MVRTVPLVQAAKEVEINGVRLQYVEQGSGEAMVFVHGAPSDLATGSPSERGSLASIGFSPTPSDISGPRRGPMMERILAFRLSRTI
jgi:pimeloyl-ACP methyl ester carboxylesterase